MAKVTGNVYFFYNTDYTVFGRDCYVTIQISIIVSVLTIDTK